MRRYASHILILALSCSAGAETWGYKVHSRSQTLIQIARDVYKDEREWKDIAYWNGIKPPYALSVGQVLLLKNPPLAKIPQESLVTGESLNGVKPHEVWASVARQIEKDGGGWIYVVNERAPSLMMIARELYGDEHMAGEIAAWGGFEPNDRLSLGQRLRLKKAPTKTEAEGNAILIKKWTALENDMMVERLGGSPALVTKNQPVKDKTKSARQPACNCPCGGGPAPASASGAVAPGAAVAPADGGAVSGTGAVAGGAAKGPDGEAKIPTAHKTEGYWLGDDAPHLIKTIDKKLRSIKGNKSPPQ